MNSSLITRLADLIDPFLSNWSEGMDHAGYLRYTTAKREDCIRSFNYFVDPMLEFLQESDGILSFGELVSNTNGWADQLIEVAKRHRLRGVTMEMYIGCFKTFVHALEQVIIGMEAGQETKNDALAMIRRFADAYETIQIKDWTKLAQKEAVIRLRESNRQLTLEKNKYENILTATSDLVLITDHTGAIIDANAATRALLGDKNITGQYFWEILGLEGSTIEEALRYYTVGGSHEINPFDGENYFNMRILPLNSVSLATTGYTVLLTNVSCFVGQRESLEKTVLERTTALENTEKKYSALFQAAGESILLVDTDFKVIEANRRAAQVFGFNRDKLVGVFCDDLCQPNNNRSIVESIRKLDEKEIWNGIMLGKRSYGQVFPIDVTINRVDLDSRTVFQVLVRDVTRQKALEENLRREKSQMEELNITLRTVMRNIDNERKELQKAFARNVEDLLLPALDKVATEQIQEVRNGYLDIIRDQLIKLATGADWEQDGRLLKLTPTEMKVCQFIQAGSPTKSIADTMGLSVETIQTHRKSIRKKLGLRGRNVNLYTFLNSPNKHYLDNRSKAAG